MNPLVSILIPAYNAEATLAETLQSAMAQTWQRKEIIVVNDGSTDRTAQVMRRHAAPNVILVSAEKQGVSSAMNLAFQHSQGEYIQVLDADDLLLPNKIERQVAALREDDDPEVLLSSAWAPFYYRSCRAEFIRNALCQDLSPVEWLLRKMGQNLHMGDSTWLFSRKLAEAAGPWNAALEYDQDGEYFARVLVHSKGTRFVAGTGALYRIKGSNRVSYIGSSDKKKESLLASMKMHIEYLRELEDSERVRQASVQYMQTWYRTFYPERLDLVAELERMAEDLQGRLVVPALGWKYSWVKRLFGWNGAKWAQETIPQMKASCIRGFDKAMHKLEPAKRSSALNW